MGSGGVVKRRSILAIAVVIALALVYSVGAWLMFTADRADWYAGLGWTRLRAQRLGNGIEVAVMCVSP